LEANLGEERMEAGEDCLYMCRWASKVEIINDCGCSEVRDVLDRFPVGGLDGEAEEEPPQHAPLARAALGGNGLYNGAFGKDKEGGRAGVAPITDAP